MNVAFRISVYLGITVGMVNRIIEVIKEEMK